MVVQNQIDFKRPGEVFNIAIYQSDPVEQAHGLLNDVFQCLTFLVSVSGVTSGKMIENICLNNCYHLRRSMSGTIAQTPDVAAKIAVLCKGNELLYGHPKDVRRHLTPLRRWFVLG
ncbi:hypothetical protein SAMN05444340_105194 [Citreimonas salinaria]|uniref:Uncharacterized protein n=1 Tax=Citreimonas salinaria TaxID=321339 RepID=A0A1H3IP41_9RHOB|nr:hypothetical protein SAMN05444340_105194 [Citreimonas salinaria]